MQTIESLVEFIKSLFRDGWGFLKSSNFYLTLITLITAIAPKVGEVLEVIGLGELAEAIGSGDPEIVFLAVLAIVNSIYHMFLKDRLSVWLKNLIASFYKDKDKEN